MRRSRARSERILTRLAKDKKVDLESAEFHVRSAMLAQGAAILQAYLDALLADEEPPTCCDNHLPATMKSTAKRPKTLRTILGQVTIWRRRFECPLCHRASYPADEALGVVDTSFSPGVRRMMAHVGAMEPFAQRERDLLLLAAVSVGAKEIERVAEQTGREVEQWEQDEGARARGLAAMGVEMVQQAPKYFYNSFDGTGIPVRGDELDGVKGKDGARARTREVKLGCAFTQTGLDEKGRPMRDEASTTYVGAIEASTEFGHRIHAEAVRRGMNQAEKVIVLTDGMPYNKTIAATHFPNAIHIIDLYHAREHLAAFARDIARIPLDSSWHKKARRHLDHGRTKPLLEMLRQILPRSGPRRKAGQKQIRYFEANAPHMRYGHFRKEGYFIGSGVIEAGCRTVVGSRLKRSGMFWSVSGANAIIALRCCILSGRFEQFCEDQAA